MERVCFTDILPSLHSASTNATSAQLTARFTPLSVETVETNDDPNNHRRPAGGGVGKGKRSVGKGLGVNTIPVRVRRPDGSIPLPLRKLFIPARGVCRAPSMGQS